MKRLTGHIVNWTLWVISIAVTVALPMGIRGVNAQDLGGDQSRRGTAGAAHLRIPVTARLASVGAAGTAGLPGLSGIEALFPNPAGLMQNQGTGVLFSRMEYVVDTAINTIGVAQQLGSSNLGLFISSWDFGDIDRQSEFSPEITDHQSFSPTILTAGVVYARQFTDRIAAGITVKMITEDIDDLVATAVGFDGGITYVISNTGLRFGFSVKNIGTKLEYRGAGLTRRVQIQDQRPDAEDASLVIEAEPVDLPTLLNFGVSYTRQLTNNATVSILGNFRSNSFDQDQYAFGAEIGLMGMLFIRGGFDLLEHRNLTMFKSGNYGAGLNMNIGGLDFTLDYAYRPTNFFSDVQMITVNVAI